MREVNVKWPWEKGNILVISIISLVVLAGLSVAVLSTSVSEKKLAGNEQEQNLAKQAAEYAVTMGKKDLSEKWAVGMCECQTSPCSCSTNAPWVWLTAQFVNADPVDSSETWWNNFGTAVAKPTAQLFSAPQYIIIDLGCDVVANVMRFRIIGRGLGTKQESVAFSDVTFSMPFNKQNVSSGQTSPVDALVDGVVQTTFNMAQFTASASFYKKGVQCQTGASSAQCEMNCAGQVRVMAWTADSHCAPTYGSWAGVGVPSTVNLTLAGAPHTITCQMQVPPPPPPPPGGGTENPHDNGKHKGYAYGHTKQDNWENGNSDNPGSTPP
ncbi:MAG TPA: PilX N-terminal domain-containing pilus assembly protein [Gammaproteobacteria bacterium]|nr:PilX N-terminal domain-containing pilus assembly protein [Gammaproteobacteria bacterium]HQZ87177.1 PilX N-terminal domain-containing pilus assembly protein [Gammaproteobacteria bacterium]HRA43183.1 PilX N-terminal domain-containing pilus assembly protein [Gammaproteobacteria bacterium]